MVRLKRILWILLVCQALVILVMMRKYLRNIAEDSHGASKSIEIRNKTKTQQGSLNSSLTAGDKQPERMKKSSYVRGVIEKSVMKRRRRGSLDNSDKKVFEAKSRIVDQEGADDISSTETPVAEKTKDTTNGAKIASSEDPKEISTQAKNSIKDKQQGIQENVHKNHEKTDESIAEESNHKTTNSDSQENKNFAHFSVNDVKRKPSNSTKFIVEDTGKETKEAEFSRNWCRFQQARTDWKNILKPCENHTVWGEKHFNISQGSSAKTSYISLWDIRPVGSFSRFLIESRTAENEKKSIGGDSWRVHLRGPASIGPTVFDLNNGSYEVLFLVMEPGSYKVEIWLDYTLCNGLKDTPPFFFKSGKTQDIHD